MERKIKSLLTLWAFVAPFSLYCLVEYGSSEISKSDRALAVRPKNTTKLRDSVTTRGENISSSRLSSPYQWESSLRYESRKAILYQQAEAGKATPSTKPIRFDMARFEGHLQTPYSFFVHTEYYTGKRSDLVKNDRWERGNPLLLVGVNWLQSGTPSDKTGLDLYAGFQWGVKKSALATSRHDKIVGLLTKKSFSSLLMALQGEMRFSSDAHQSHDLSLSSMTKVALKGGYIVSNDIRFELETAYYNLRPSKREKRFTENLSYSSFSGSLFLEFIPSFEFILGIQLPITKPRYDFFEMSRIYTYDYSNSSSFLMGINFYL